MRERHNPHGDMMLIAGIIRQALVDAIAYKRPRFMPMIKPFWQDVFNIPDIKGLPQRHVNILIRNKKKQLTKDQLKRYEKLAQQREIETMSYEARQFINKDCHMFKQYCYMLDLEPEWCEAELWNIINANDTSPCSKKIKFDTFLDMTT